MIHFSLLYITLSLDILFIKMASIKVLYFDHLSFWSNKCSSPEYQGDSSERCDIVWPTGCSVFTPEAKPILRPNQSTGEVSPRTSLCLSLSLSLSIYLYSLHLPSVSLWFFMPYCISFFSVSLCLSISLSLSLSLSFSFSFSLSISFSFSFSLFLSLSLSLSLFHFFLSFLNANCPYSKKEF